MIYLRLMEIQKNQTMEIISYDILSKKIDKNNKNY